MDKSSYLVVTRICVEFDIRARNMPSHAGSDPSGMPTDSDPSGMSVIFESAASPGPAEAGNPLKDLYAIL